MKKWHIFVALFLFWFLWLSCSSLSWGLAANARPFKNLVLPLKDAPEGKVTLKNGRFSRRYSKDSATSFWAVIERHAISSWEGSRVAAVVLSYGTGGSGIYKRLYFLVEKERGWQPKGWIDLGDRVRIRYLSLYRHGAVYLGLIEHKKEEPLCCPTKRVLKVFNVTEKGLIPAATYRASLFPDEMACNATLIDPSARLEMLPEVSSSLHNMGHSSPIPAHVALLIKNKHIAMRVINVKDYLDMWWREHDPTINIAVHRLKRALKKDVRQLSPPFDILPPRPGINDFALFVSKIHFKNGLGIGFVGRVTKDVTCVDKSQLRFFYMGLDEKGKYLVTMSLKVNPSPAIPERLWTCKKGIKGLKKQIGEIEKFMSGIGERRAFPGLLRIKRFLASLEIRQR